MSNSLISSVLATRDEWSDQAPSLLYKRRVEAGLGVGVGRGRTNKSAQPPIHTGTKRKAHASHATRGAHELEEETINLEAIDHRLAPCFGLLPKELLPANLRTATTNEIATPSSAASTSSTMEIDQSTKVRNQVDRDADVASSAGSSNNSSTPSTTPPVLPVTPFFSTTVPTISKRARKVMTQDYSSFKTSLTDQAMRTLNETLPRAVLRLKRREEEFNAELALLKPNEEEEEYYFTPEVEAACTTASSQLGVEPDDTNRPARLQPETEEVDVPLTSFAQHRPNVRHRLPELGCKQVHHGWTFYQPTRSHPTHEFNNAWVGILQSELSEFVVVLQLLRTSFTLSLPSASDTNNLDIEIMEELLSELKDHMDWTNNLRGRLCHYADQRAKLLSKVYKYPGVADYKAAVRELDQYIRITLGLNWLTLRNGYTWIHQLYLRNEEKLQMDLEHRGSKAFHSML